MKAGLSGVVLSLGLVACQSALSTPETQEAFDFGGVYDDTHAGEIDRTVVPRRPDGPPNVVLIIADDLGWPYLGFLGDDNVVINTLE